MGGSLSNSLHVNEHHRGSHAEPRRAAGADASPPPAPAAFSGGSERKHKIRSFASGRSIFFLEAHRKLCLLLTLTVRPFLLYLASTLRLSEPSPGAAAAAWGDGERGSAP